MLATMDQKGSTMKIDLRSPALNWIDLENGKIRAEAAFEVEMIPSKFRYWASVVLTNYGRALEVWPGHFSIVTRSAIGVAGIVAPFNSPLVLTAFFGTSPGCWCHHSAQTGSTIGRSCGTNLRKADSSEAAMAD